MQIINPWDSLYSGMGQFGNALQSYGQAQQIAKQNALIEAARQQKAQQDAILFDAQQQTAKLQQNALIEKAAQEQQQRQAENALFKNMPFLQGQPEIYGEQSAVAMQDIANQYPNADLSSIYSSVDKLAPEKEKPLEYDILQDASGNYQYIPKKPGTPVYPTGIKGKVAKERPGMALSVNPDGTVTFSEGIEPMTKGTVAKTEQEVLDLNDSISRLNEVQSGFKKEYLQIPEQIKQKVLEGKSRWVDLTPEEKKQVQGFTSFKQGSMRFLNEEIKRLTGAAITKQEEPRLRAAMPDPESDGPEQFQQKLDNTVRDMKFAIARKNYALKRGVAFGNIPYSSMPEIINKRGSELEQTLRAKGVTQENIQNEVRKMLTSEFGI